MPSVISWVIIKLALPLIGILTLIINLVMIIMGKKSGGMLELSLSLIICLFYISPILITLNVVSIAYPARINSVKPALTIKWPFVEETIVAWGGDSIKTNLPHAMWGSERWAYDLVMNPYNTNNPDLKSYGIWDKEVFSPVYGIIIAAYDGDKDIPPNQDEFESLEGNYVYIKVEESGTYLLLNHFRQNSIVVSVGDKVSPGDLLGHVGNSGTSSEPHLHIHHQRQDPTKTFHPLFAESLPLYFETFHGIIMPEGGTVIIP